MGSMATATGGFRVPPAPAIGIGVATGISGSEPVGGMTVPLGLSRRTICGVGVGGVSVCAPVSGTGWVRRNSVNALIAVSIRAAFITGSPLSIIYNEFGNVYIQPDICNGCAYCVAACPFGVVTRSDFSGHARKCTLCYDRQKDGLVPACAKACPTASIQFGPLDELKDRAGKRVELAGSVMRP